MISSLLGFLFVFLGGIAFVIFAARSYKAQKEKARKKNKETTAPTSGQEKREPVATPQSNLALVLGGWLLFNLVVWMVLPGAWSWWISKGLFFWGTQVAVIVLLLLNLVFKKEGNKRQVVVLSLLIATVLIAGFISQINWGGGDDKRKQSAEISIPRGVVKVIAPSEGYSMEEIYVGPSIYWNAPKTALEVMFRKNGMVVWVFKQSPFNHTPIPSKKMWELQGATIHFRSLGGDQPVYVCTTARACRM
ncbi:MAG: hypothetical protein NUV42_02330 [Candidatus Yonathbacteria bacterium]|nr:hypothetical protein [Candidatus Yonathbacteria bacterium]